MSGNVSSGFGRMYTLFLVENIGAECQFRVPQEFIINVLVEIIAESVIYFFVCMLGRAALAAEVDGPGTGPGPARRAPRPARQ